MRTLLKKAFMEKRNKKGSYVDWAVSMGIFLIYLIGLFILLRPGVTPIYKPEGLLQIVENKFMENVSWVVREIPLFVEKCKFCNVQGKSNPSIVKVSDASWNFLFSKYSCEKYDGSVCITPYNSEKPLYGSFTITCKNDDNNPNFEKYKFTLVYYPSKNKDAIANFKLVCFPSADCCKAFLGSSISKKGINPDWLAKLKSAKIPYEDLKKSWDFPVEMNFAVYTGGSEDTLEKLNGAEEPQGINLFIKQFKTQTIDKSGKITPITINLRAW